MEETLITFETAKLAREKGLMQKIISFDYYLPDGKKVGATYARDNRDYKRYSFYAPTQTLLQKWLREVHMIRVYPTHSSCGTFNYEIYIWNNPNDIGLWTRIGNVPSFESFEEALEKGLQEALKLII